MDESKYYGRQGVQKHIFSFPPTPLVPLRGSHAFKSQKSKS
ncbi:hypothetical protein SAMD00079811_04040 [Scytonema sp. HK-05]|nr:hypothetical protein SAMD00079811_04040 [Scytonema sp. HK-05]